MITGALFFSGMSLVCFGLLAIAVSVQRYDGKSRRNDLLSIAGIVSSMAGVVLIVFSLISWAISMMEVAS